MGRISYAKDLGRHYIADLTNSRTLNTSFHENAIENAQKEFAAALTDFKSARVWRLVVFTIAGERASDFVAELPMGSVFPLPRTNSKDADRKSVV